MADNKFDPNIYALSMALQLDTAEAFKDLTDFGTQLETTEQKIADAAQKALASIDKVTAQIGTHLKMISDLSSKMADATGIVDTKLVKVESTTDALAETHEDQLERLQKQIDLQEEIFKATTEHEKALQREMELQTDLTGEVRKIAEGIDRKNLSHQEELELVEAECRQAQALSDGFADVNGNIQQAHGPLRDIRQLLFATVGLIREAEEGAERFVTVNFRAYGSQRDLLQISRDLTTEYGLLRGQALEAMEALGNLRVPRDELQKTAVVVSQFSRVTGLNITQVAEWTKALRTGGMTLPAIEKHMIEVTEAMRKMGLSSGDLNRILGQTGATAFSLSKMFPDDKDVVAKFDNIKLHLEGLGRYAGGDGAAELTQFLDSMDPLEMLKFASMAGVAGDEIGDYMQGIANIGVGMQQEYDAVIKAGGNAKEALVQVTKAGAVAFKGNERAAEQAFRLAENARKMGLNFADAADRAKIFEMATTSLTDAFDEANRTLPAQLNILATAWVTIRDNVLGFIGDALLPLLPYISTAVQFIANLIGQLRSGLSAMDEWGGAWKAVAGVLRIVVGGFLLLLTIGLPLQMTFSLLGTAATYLGTMFGTALTAVGNGLRALGASVQQVMLPLLALGAAMLMAGAGSLMFMQGVVMVADLGWAAIPAILGMTAAIGLLGLVLVGLAYLAMPVIPALLAIGAAVLMIGAAAWLMGAGMQMGAKAFEETHDAIGPHSPAMWVALPMIATGLLAVSAAAIIAAPAMLALSIGMWAVAIPGLLLIPVVTALTVALAGISAINVEEAASSLYNASINFVMAGTNLLIAGVQISLGAVALTAGFVMMTAAMLLATPLALAMGMAAGALWLAGIVFAPAAAKLEQTGQQLARAGEGVRFGGAGLLAGSTALFMANAVLNSVGMGLYVAASFLAYGLGLLIPVAAKAVLVGLAFQFGGATLLGGLQDFEEASNSIRKTADVMGPAAMEIDRATMALSKAAGSLGTTSDKLVLAAPKVEKAGLILVPAAGSLKLGLDAIKGAVAGIDQVTPDIEKLRVELTNLATAAPQFVTIGIDLLAGANKFQSAAGSISQALQALSSSLNGFQVQGTQFEAQLELLVSLLDHYAELLEQTAVRIETAIFAKAIPAILAAEQAGLEEAVRAETITTVQVLDQRDDDGTGEEQVALLREQNEILRALQQTIQNSLNDSKVADIVEMLATFLPDLADQGQSGVDRRFSNWIT